MYKQERREWFCVFTSVVSFCTVLACAYSIGELRNRGFWMEDINTFRKDVEERTKDRWIATQDAEQDAKDWEAFFRANPELNRFEK